jgi:hypothetical protein
MICTFRRELILNFLYVNYIKPNKRQITFNITDNFKYQIKNTIKEYAVNQVEYKIPNSAMYGFLMQYTIHPVKKNVFVEKFAILCNLGLYFYDTIEFGPIIKTLIPIAGCAITKVN